jgi:hypothetical protein
MPDGTDITAAPVCRYIDKAIVKPLARAFRWRDMLESGEYATIRDVAAAEKINEQYTGRVLRLTLLAPEIVEAILNGQQPRGLQLDDLLRPFPIGWEGRNPMSGLNNPYPARHFSGAPRSRDTAKSAQLNIDDHSIRRLRIRTGRFPNAFSATDESGVWSDIR